MCCVKSRHSTATPTGCTTLSYIITYLYIITTTCLYHGVLVIVTRLNACTVECTAIIGRLWPCLWLTSEYRRNLYRLLHRCTITNSTLYKISTRLRLYQTGDPDGTQFNKTAFAAEGYNTFNQTLTLRALWICSPSFLELELDFIKSVFLENGYPLEVIQSSRRAVQLQQKKEPVFGPENCPIYVKLPYIGSASKCFRTVVQIAVQMNITMPKLWCFPTPENCFKIRVKMFYPWSLRAM